MNKLIKIQGYILLFLGLLTPMSAFAASGGVSAGNISLLFGTGLASAKTLPELIYDVVQLLLFFAFGVAVLFIIIGGYFYLTAQGNEEQSEKGRKALTNAIIGIVIIIMSYAIVSVVRNTVLLPYTYVGN